MAVTKHVTKRDETVWFVGNRGIVVVTKPLSSRAAW